MSGIQVKHDSNESVACAVLQLRVLTVAMLNEWVRHHDDEVCVGFNDLFGIAANEQEVNKALKKEAGNLQRWGYWQEHYVNCVLFV